MPANGVADGTGLEVPNPFLEEVDEELGDAPGPAEDETAPPMPPFEVPTGEDEISSETAPRVDRAAVVRELASLFSDEEEPPRRPRASADDPEDQVPDGYVKRRVEDDDQINKGLIGRFIDGVKGM